MYENIELLKKDLKRFPLPLKGKKELEALFPYVQNSQIILCASGYGPYDSGKNCWFVLTDTNVFIVLKASMMGAPSIIASVLDIVTSASGEDAIFIDTATGNETKVVPTSRAVSVSTYLEAGYEYEPVVMTIADEATSGNSNTNIEGNNNYVLGASGAGCNTVLLGFFALPFALCLFKKKRA